MGQTTSLIIGMLALAAASFGYSFTQSYIVAILFAIIVVLIGKSLQPAILVLWDKFTRRFFPLPELTEFFEKGLHPTEDYTIPPNTQGLRVLAMTEELPLNSKSRPVYTQMVQESLKALSEEFPLFALRLNACEKRDLPQQYVCSLCGIEGEKMSKCLKAWLKSYAVRDMKARTQNKDLFLHDGEVNVPGKTDAVRYTVMVLFDGSLPVTLPAQAETHKQESSETTS